MKIKTDLEKFLNFTAVKKSKNYISNKHNFLKIYINNNIIARHYGGHVYHLNDDTKERNLRIKYINHIIYKYVLIYKTLFQ
jgi:hypothetical protein